MTTYDKLREAGCEIDSHESDLYVISTKKAHAILREDGQRGTYFISPKDRRLWIEVPFAYSPWWDAHAGSKS